MNIRVDLLLQLENAHVGMRSALQQQPSLAGNGELVEDTGTVAQHPQLDLMRPWLLPLTLIVTGPHDDKMLV